MPKALERLVRKIRAKGMPEQSAWAIATDRLQRSGVLKKGTQKLARKKAKKK